MPRNMLDDECMTSLGLYIKSSKSVERVDLSHNFITNQGIRILANYLDGNTSLRLLIINYQNEINDKSIPFLLKMIESSYIQGISIYGTSITRKNELAIPLARNVLKSGSPLLCVDYM